MCPNMRCDVFCQKNLASKHGLISPFMCTVCFHCRHFICELCIAVSIFFPWKWTTMSNQPGCRLTVKDVIQHDKHEREQQWTGALFLACSSTGWSSIVIHRMHQLSEVGRQQYSDAGTGGSLPCQVKWFPFLSLVHCYMDLFYRSLLGIWKHYS